MYSQEETVVGCPWDLLPLSLLFSQYPLILRLMTYEPMQVVRAPLDMCTWHCLPAMSRALLTQPKFHLTTFEIAWGTGSILFFRVFQANEARSRRGTRDAHQDCCAFPLPLLSPCLALLASSALVFARQKRAW